MAVFEYKGFDAKGGAAIGIVDADSPKGARTKLRRQGVFATDVYEQKGGGAATRGAGLNVSIDFKKYFERVSSQDFVEVVAGGVDAMRAHCRRVVPAPDGSQTAHDGSREMLVKA